MNRMLSLAPLVLLATGCTDGGSAFFNISFNRLDVQDINFDQVETDFVFQVNNRTPLGFQIDNFDYALAFEEIEWLSGADPDGLTLYASDSSEVSLPLTIVFQDIYDVAQATRGEDNIGFGLDGSFGIRLSQETLILEPSEAEETGDTGDTAASDAEVDNASAGQTIQLPYDAGGDFPALRRPRFSFKKLKVGAIDWASLVAPVTLKLDVENDHASSLFLTNFDYNLSLGGQPVASGLVDDLGEVFGATADSESAGATVLNIPINLDLASLGVTVYNAIVDGGTLNIGLDASTDVDTPFGVVTLGIDETGDISVE